MIATCPHSQPWFNPRSPGSLSRKIRITVVAADGLAKRDVFRLPDPFAIVTVDGEQTHSTSVIKKTLNPYWNDSFDVTVTDSSVIAVQIFDQKKFKKRDQGFLGVINIRVADVLDLELGGKRLLNKELKKSNDNLVVHGKLIIDLNTNVSTPSTTTPPPAPPTSSCPHIQRLLRLARHSLFHRRCSLRCPPLDLRQRHHHTRCRIGCKWRRRQSTGIDGRWRVAFDQCHCRRRRRRRHHHRLKHSYPCFVGSCFGR